MNIDSDKLKFYLYRMENKVNRFTNRNLEQYWRFYCHGEHEYGDAEDIPETFLAGFKDGILVGLDLIMDAIEEAEDKEWSLLR